MYILQHHNIIAGEEDFNILHSVTDTGEVELDFTTCDEKKTLEILIRNDSIAEQDEEIFITLHKVKFSHAVDGSIIKSCTKQSTLKECSHLVLDPEMTKVTILDDDCKFLCEWPAT